jgi:glycolate oxidase FAD binding subunit
VRDVAGSEEDFLWADHMRRPWAGGGCIVKLAVLPTDLAPTFSWIAQALVDGSWEVAGRAGLGVVHLRIDGEADGQARFISALRERLAPGRGSAVLLRGSPALKKLVDVWGPIGDGAPLMRAVKRQFDPAGILNPGRGPGGL